jgi:hypothetical protein
MKSTEGWRPKEIPQVELVNTKRGGIMTESERQRERRHRGWGSVCFKTAKAGIKV